MINAVRARHREINELRLARAAARPGEDPLIRAQRRRADRRPSVIQARGASVAAEQARVARNGQRQREIDEKREATRASMAAVAPIARSLGWAVRESRAQGEQISSYYITPPGRRGAIRVSDHKIPEAAASAWAAERRGEVMYRGYPAPQIIIKQPRRAEWIRRALLTARDRMPVEGE